MIKTSLLLLLFSSISYATSFSDGSKKFGLSGGNDACWFDFNNDGWTDVCVGGNVYRNIEGKKFVFITKTGPSVAADFDNDGFLDLYSWGNRKVYRNIDGKEFKIIELPELPKGGSLGACWGDFNGDGFVDIYAGGYETWPSETYADFILMNKGGNHLIWNGKKLGIVPEVLAHVILIRTVTLTCMCPTTGYNQTSYGRMMVKVS